MEIPVEVPDVPHKIRRALSGDLCPFMAQNGRDQVITWRCLTCAYLEADMYFEHRGDRTGFVAHCSYTRGRGRPEKVDKPCRKNLQLPKTKDPKHTMR